MLLIVKAYSYKMDKKIIILIGIGVIVTFSIYLGLQNSLKVPALFSTPISSKEAIMRVAQKENLTQYNISDFSTKYVYIKGDGTIFECDINSNSIGKYLGKSEPTTTTGSYFAWEVIKNNHIYFVDSATGEIISEKNNNFIAGA
jgi:hypothetical protein